MAALKRHLAFFNTNGTWGAIIHGAVIAMEEERAAGADIPDEAIIGLKTGLMAMGAAAISSIVLSLTLPMAMAGNWLGVFLNWFVTGTISLYIAYTLWFSGYRLGRASITRILEGGWINPVI